MSWSDPTTEEVLLEAAALLDAAREEGGWRQPAWIVHVELPAATAGELGLAFKSLAPGLHPLAALSGWSAPPGWACIGVVAEGAVRALDGGLGTEGARARIVHLVARDGTAVSRLRVTTGEVQVTAGPAAAEGAIPNALRRSLGLAGSTRLEAPSGSRLC
jgi:hypothetical protein